MVEGNKNSREASSGGSGDQLFGLGLIGMLVLTVFYLDYRIKVQLCLVLASIIIEVATVGVYYNSRKAQVIYEYKRNVIFQYGRNNMYSAFDRNCQYAFIYIKNRFR